MQLLAYNKFQEISLARRPLFNQFAHKRPQTPPIPNRHLKSLLSQLETESQYLDLIIIQVLKALSHKKLHLRLTTRSIRI